ncbi:MAG: ice-binding family protein [Clostridiaceae bacterium]|nr:ice-binding family protein [Clostridiaceae bacterium]
MKILNKMQFTSLFLTLLLMVMLVKPITVQAAQPKVNLGTTETYAVLAGSAITNTGSTVISGEVGSDVGIAPGKAFTGQASMTIGGEVNVANDKARLAKKDLITAYNDAAGRKPVTRIPSELGGQTLKPGVYDSADGTFLNSTKLTLDAEGDPDGVFIFKTDKSLTTAPNSTIETINGARFCRTFWKIGSSATLGVSSHFVGHIFALDSITANNSASIQGQLLARNGAVTLDNNVITNGFCGVKPEDTPKPSKTTTLTVNKEVINDDGGKAIPSDFKVSVKNVDTGKTVTTSPKDISKYILNGGIYTVNISNIPGYTISYKGINSNGKITISPGDNKTIIFTSNDNSPTAITSTIKDGQLPNTSSHLYEILIIGGALTMVGALGWRKRKSYE